MPSKNANTLTVAQAVKRIEAACQSGGAEAGIYCQIPLMPVGGYENKVKPPTYAGAVKGSSIYAEEERFIDGHTVQTVYLGTVQDAANRMEVALLERMRAGDILVPNVEIDCQYDDKTRSMYELPHRFSDFHMKGSLLDQASFKFPAQEKNQPFRNTTMGQRIYGTYGEDFNDEILRFCPLGVLLGGWNSFGDKTNKEVKNKLHRCIMSETVAVKAGKGIHTQSRIDPIVQGGQLPFRGTNNMVNIADLGGGNIPPSTVYGSPGGMSVSKITENWCLQFQALLRYSTAKYKPGKQVEYQQRREQDVVAREMLVWLGIAMHIFRANNYFYRSGCALQRLDEANKYVFSKDDASFIPTEAEAITQYNKAAEKLEKAGRYDRKFYMLLKLDPAINTLAYQQMTQPTKGDLEKAKSKGKKGSDSNTD